MTSTICHHGLFLLECPGCTSGGTVKVTCAGPDNTPGCGHTSVPYAAVTVVTVAVDDRTSRDFYRFRCPTCRMIALRPIPTCLRSVAADLVALGVRTEFIGAPVVRVGTGPRLTEGDVAEFARRLQARGL